VTDSSHFVKELIQTTPKLPVTYLLA